MYGYDQEPWRLDNARLQMPDIVPYAPQSSSAQGMFATPSSPKPSAEDLPLRNPYLDAASLGLKAVGTGLQQFGINDQRKNDERNWQAQLRAYEDSRADRRGDVMRRDRLDEEARGGALTGYARQANADDLATMLPYNRAIGR